MIKHITQPKNLVYFLNTIAFYTFGSDGGDTPCPYKLLVGSPRGPSTIKEVSDDEKYRSPYFGYSEKVVHDITSIKIKPEIGDVIIINPIHYHTISKIKGKHDRISTGFFFAPTNEQALVCWA